MVLLLRCLKKFSWILVSSAPFKIPYHFLGTVTSIPQRPLIYSIFWISDRSLS